MSLSASKLSHGLQLIEIFPGNARAFVVLVCVRRAFTHVNRTQPEAPEGDLQERAQTSDAVDAGLRHERDDECRTVHVGDVGKWVARGKACRQHVFRR
jgi:hypothetical protein